MHAMYYATLPKTPNSFFLYSLLLRVGDNSAWSAANGGAGLYRCVGNRHVAEVVLADGFEGVGVFWVGSALCALRRSSSACARTDSANKSEQNKTSHHILDQVWLASTVEGGCRAVLLVVVRRLGHAVRRISFEEVARDIPI